MLNIFKITRASEWWEYKLPPLLSVAYATAISEGKSLYALAPRIGILLLGIIVGAAYVSIINDVTDIKEDRASGKHNRLYALRPWLRWVLVLITVFSGIFFAYFFLHGLLSTILYSLSWIAFSLYSIPPFRLKKRGWWGVMADAGGAHLFTSLFLLSATAQYFKIQINWAWFIAIGIWSFLFGLRGILWHQFFDRENDLKIGLKTFATSRDPSSFKKASSFILAIELMVLCFLLFYLASPLPFIGLLFYFIMLVGYSKKFGLALIAIVPPKNQPWHFLMSNYYQLFLPLSLICTAALKEPAAWIVFAAHLILFPAITRNMVLDIYLLSKALIKKLVF